MDVEQKDEKITAYVAKQPKRTIKNIGLNEVYVIELEIKRKIIVIAKNKECLSPMIIFSNLWDTRIFPEELLA